MTLERLKQYRIVAEQIKLISEKYIPSYLPGVDTTKPSVQSGHMSDITSDIALRQLSIEPQIRDEYIRLRAELQEMNNFIFGINDELVRAIIIRRYIMGMKWECIAYDLGYSKKYCQKKAGRYLAQNFEQAPKRP